MKKIIYILFALAVLYNCKESANENNSLDNDATTTQTANSNSQDLGEEATFVHTVFFWMKEDITEEEAKFFEEGMEKLGKVPSIHSYKWGKPAGTPREVVDNSYDYAWIVDFVSAEDQDAYQVDPIHVKFVEESKDLWSKVQVYDTIID